MKTSFVVITTINEVNNCIQAWAREYPKSLIVVGDLKTPSNWHLPDNLYISPEDRGNSRFKINSVLPFNHYSRKMLGYLTAFELGADVVIDSDDDNMPSINHQFPSFEGNFDLAVTDDKYFNAFRHFSSPNERIWPRGLPLKWVNRPTTYRLQTENISIGVWQGLADGDSDVDAIYRLTSDKPIKFIEAQPLVMPLGVLAPFNSQNTAFVRKVFPLLYLPGFVTFRFTDILRGYVAQHVMKVHNLHLGYSGASVFQERNPHDYLIDFISEYPMYVHTEEINEVLSSAVKSQYGVRENLLMCYEALFYRKFVKQEEMELLEAWNSDLVKIGF